MCIGRLTGRDALPSRAAALFCVWCSLAVFLPFGSVVDCMGQSQAEQKPPAISTTTPRQKPGAGQEPVAIATSTRGTINGRVISDDGRPLTNAIILARAVTGVTVTKPARVDEQGKFAFDDLPTAAYILVATAPGYIDQSITLADQSQWPRYLIGAQLKITMIKGGVITGTVTNPKGDPVVGVSVVASPTNELSVSASNLLGLQNLGETDDRGIYRIYGLLPGQYTVSAGRGMFAKFTASGFDLDAPTYYPSATRDTAIPVSVRGGEETSSIDIKYRGTEGRAISGFVTGAIGEGSAAGQVMIDLSPAGRTSILSLAFVSEVDSRRSFSFEALADGEYDLFASFQTTANGNPLVGTRRVTVRGGDVTGIELKLAPLAGIAGTITLDPIKPEDKCDKRAAQLIETVISAPADDPKKGASRLNSTLLGFNGATLNERGEFAVRNLDAGKYRLATTLPTEAWYLRAITLPTTPSLKGPQAATTQRAGEAWPGVVTLKSGERLAPVSIIVGQDAAGLSGRVARTPEGSAIPPGLRVHLVPEERERADSLLRYSEVLVNADGSFAFTNLAPGRYFVFARIEPAIEAQPTLPRPTAWDLTARIKLRREAAAASTVVELKPCQRLVDYTLALKTSP